MTQRWAFALVENVVSQEITINSDTQSSKAPERGIRTSSLTELSAMVTSAMRFAFFINYENSCSPKLQLLVKGAVYDEVHKAIKFLRNRGPFHTEMPESIMPEPQSPPLLRLGCPLFA